jgi:2-dehydro-3-deoxygluconokinase
MKRFVTLGEIMLRLKSPGQERLLQSPILEASFGGAEANVAVSLANFGHSAAFVSALPANAIGDAALAELRRHGVEVSGVIRTGERVGIYYLEAGAADRPSDVVYDRAGSALATAAADAFDWNAIFTNAGWLHVSGITPALSASAASLTLTACSAARQRGITVSLDLNHRRKLWRYGKSAPEVLTEIFALVDVGIGSREDCQLSLGIDEGGSSRDAAATARLADLVMQRFPNLRALALTQRELMPAGRQRYFASLGNKAGFLTGPSHEIGTVVDPIGAGDAFAAGLIHGLATGLEPPAALAFATAAGVLKHTIPGDFNRVSLAEVERLAHGQAADRVQR